MGVYNSFRLFGFGGGPLVAGVVVSAGPYGIRGAETALDTTFVLGIATLVMAASIALLATIEPLVNERLAQGPVMFSVQFAALIAALAVLQPVTARWSDRLGRADFVFWGLVALVPVTLVQGFVTASWQLIVARVAQGAAAAAVFAPALALAGELAGDGESGSKLSVLTMAFALGLAVGQFASGFLVAFGFAVPFAFGGALAAVGAALVRSQVRDPSVGLAASATVGACTCCPPGCCCAPPTSMRRSTSTSSGSGWCGTASGGVRRIVASSTSWAAASWS